MHFHRLIRHAIVFFSLTLVLVSPLIGQTHKPITSSSEIVVPSQLEADAVELLRKWHRSYSAQPLNINANNDQKSGSTSRTQFNDADVSTWLSKLPTEIEVAYNSSVQKGIDLFLKQKRCMIPSMLSLGNYYFPLIETIFDKYEIPTELKYLALIESGLDPSATSRSGAKGLWQFMLPTAKAYGLEVNGLVDERMDPQKSTEAAAKHLKDLYQVYGDWLMVIAAYNCGIGNVNKAIRKSGGKSSFWGIYNYLPHQTRDYVPLFVGAYYTMHYHNEYDLHEDEAALPCDVDTIYIRDRYSIASLANASSISESLFKMINPQFKASYIPGDIHPYAIKLPIAAITRLEQSDLMLSAPGKQDPIKRDKIIVQEVTINTNPNRSYTVKRGDSLYSIARRHNVTIEALMRINDIKSVKVKLIPGKELSIPEVD